MLGDVNIFLTDPEDTSLGEVEIMIAGTGKQKHLVKWGIKPTIYVVISRVSLFIAVLFKCYDKLPPMQDSHWPLLTI